jgi:dihydropteroate synthase
LISQVINLSNGKSFKLYKEKYNYSLALHHGLYGVELRNIPEDYLKHPFKDKSDNIFCTTDEILLTGSIKEIINITHLLKFNESLNTQINKAIQNYEQTEFIEYEIGERKFDFKFAYVMGILNVTPDSFSDGGRYIDNVNAVNYALEMIEKGADIIDVGGESTRPGSEQVSETDELRRVIPVIAEILKRKPDAILSIDTTKANVAKEALKCGVLIVNDVSGGTFELEIFNVVKDFSAPIVLMHIKGKPKTMQSSPVYSDVVSEVYNYLSVQSEIASRKGLDKIIIDPGIGFGKRTEDNLNLIERLEDFKSLGFPIMMGLSRKTFIGNILNLPIEDRDDATNALNALSMCNGARIIRTHNVKLAVQTCKLFNSIIKD